MKGKSLLKISALSLLLMGAVSPAMAQTPFKDNIAGNIGGTRFVVTTPASVSGVKKISYATWSAAASPTISNVEVAKAYDTLGATTLTSTLTGKFALIYRGGGITFSDKASRCKAAGAIGVIIVNNIPGDPVGMGATPSTFTIDIPVIMVSDVDGKAINDAVLASPGSVKVTLGTWNTGGTHDLGILPDYQAVAHARNIPLHQLTGSAGTKAYKRYIGGAVANYGAATETGITVTDSIFWTPSASSSETFVTAHSYSVPSISVADSIKFGFGTGSFELPVPTTSGKYTHRHSMTYSNTDAFPQDNVATTYDYVNDSIFCKGGYDYTNARPSYSIGIRPGTTTPTDFVMGNLFYVRNGGYFARKAQFYLQHDTNPTLDAFSTLVYLMKWTDGVNAPGKTGAVKDSFVSVNELEIIAAGGKSFNNLDTSGRVINVDLLDPNSSAAKLMTVDDNSWYFLAVDVPAPLFMGMDESQSFFTRGYAQWLNGGAVLNAPIEETFGGSGFVNSSSTGFGNFNDFTADDNNFVGPFPFSGSLMTMDSVFFDRYNQIPALAFVMSKNTKTSIGETAKSIGKTSVYPNPAVGEQITVEVALDKMNKTVLYSLVDISGRSVFKETHNNVMNEKFQIPVKNIPAGTYIFIAAGEEGSSVHKLVIQH